MDWTGLDGTGGTGLPFCYWAWKVSGCGFFAAAVHSPKMMECPQKLDTVTVEKAVSNSDSAGF